MTDPHDPGQTTRIPTPPPADTWRPERHDDTGRMASVVFGLLLLGVGLWFFADRTLGLDLPRISWSQFWPVILIVLGVWIVLGARRRHR
ncbi:hypothetical protein BH20CHL7_BH20CHL7_06080 [soil metagenome]